MSETEKYPCPCCGYLTFDEKPPGTFAICQVCYWEEDECDYGANSVSRASSSRSSCHERIPITRRIVELAPTISGWELTSNEPLAN